MITSKNRQRTVIAVIALTLCVSTLYLLGAADHVKTRFGASVPPWASRPGGDTKAHSEAEWLDLQRKIPTPDMRHRYETPEIWRSDNIFTGHKEGERPKAPPHRPVQPHPFEYETPAEYLEQTLVADYPNDKIDDIFLMLKTGATVMWQRLPIHMFTTLTRVKNFALYSDMAGSIGGYEIIDILKDLPENVLLDDQLTSYRLMSKVHKEGYRWDVSDIDFHQRKDGWGNDKFKNLPMLADAYQKSPDSKWFVFMDDDTYLLWDNLVEYLSSMNHTERIYLGSRAWMTGKKHHGETLGIFAHGGSGVVISKGAMDALWGPDAAQPTKDILDHWAHTTLSMCCGDMMVAWVLFELANCTLDEFSKTRPITRFQGEPLNTVHYGPSTMCEPLMSFHHMHGHDIEIIWEYERLYPRGKPILYKDLYRDFVLPWVVPEREDWYMRHWSDEITTQKGLPFIDKDKNEIYPNATKEECRMACETYDNCYVWTWWEGTCRLKRDYIVAGHRADKDYISYESTFGASPKVWSGWMVDRIRQLRARMECDPLEYNEETGEYNDSDDEAEGWALRVRSKDRGMVRAPPPHDGSKDSEPGHSPPPAQ